MSSSSPPPPVLILERPQLKSQSCIACWSMLNRGVGGGREQPSIEQCNMFANIGCAQISWKRSTQSKNPDIPCTAKADQNKNQAVVKTPNIETTGIWQFQFCNRSSEIRSRKFRDSMYQEQPPITNLKNNARGFRKTPDGKDATNQLQQFGKHSFRKRCDARIIEVNFGPCWRCEPAFV